VNKTPYLLAAAFYGGLLIVTAPASLLDSPLRSLSQGQLSLSNCQGTIWHGSATPTLNTDKQSNMALQTLHWQIRPLALLRGTLKAELLWDDTVTPMELTVDSKTVTMTHIRLSLPAEVIGLLSPFLKPAQLSGDLQFESPRLSYTDGHLQGNATTHWNQASSAMSPIHPLGDYLIDIKATKDTLRATLSTRSGPLLLDGQGNWSPSQRFHFIGSARADGESQGTLSALLHHLGPETTPGTYQILL